MANTIYLIALLTIEPVSLKYCSSETNKGCVMFVVVAKIKKDKDKQNHDESELYSTQHTRTEYGGTFPVFISIIRHKIIFFNQLSVCFYDSRLKIYTGNINTN